VDRRLARSKGGGIPAGTEALIAGEQTRARYPEEDGYVERDGVRVFYEVYGDGEPTILLPPPWAIVHSWIWKLQIPYFARHFRVVVYDGRGNGKSDRPDSAEAYGEREQAADALAVLDATGTEQAIVVGFSWGGQWSLILAAEHPERVTAVCFLGAGPGLSGEPFPYEQYPFDEELGIDKGWAKENRYYWLRDWPGYVDWFFSQCFTEPHSTKQMEDAVGWGLETDPETMLLTEESPVLEPAEIRDLCARLTCPVLVVHGSEDAIVPYAEAVALADATGGRLVIFEGSSHCPQVRDPVRFNLLLRDFAESVA
jgi:pimeloyl-ACP methyl ester carboxylesterase